MKNYSINAVILVFGFLILVVNIDGAFGQLISYPQSTNVTFYRDGLAHCTQQFSIDALVPEITIRLLSESSQNILLLDENSTAVDYRLTGNNLTIYTLGANELLVEYDTMQLTSKEAEVWTLLLQYPYNMTIFLPLNSTVVYLSEIPLAIETMEGAITMDLTAGNWEISYILPASAPGTPTSTPNNPDQVNSGFKIEYIAIIGIVAGTFAIFGFVFFKRKRGPKVGRILKENPQLGKEDQEVIQFLIEKDGKAFEAELREKFPNMPRTSLWRLS